MLPFKFRHSLLIEMSSVKNESVTECASNKIAVLLIRELDINKSNCKFPYYNWRNILKLFHVPKNNQ